MKLCIIILLCIAAFSAVADSTFVCGSVSGVWDTAGSPYCVVCDVHVPTGDTLRTMPGVKVVFMANFGFYVDSMAVLKAIGTVGDSIIFTTSGPSVFHKAINFTKSAPGCTLAYCRVEKGSNGGIRCSNSSPVIINNKI